MTTAASSITDALAHATRLNPTAARFFAGGVMALLLAALVIGFNTDLNSVIIVALLIFALSGIFALFQIMNQNPLQRAVLSWAATLTVIALLAGYVNAALPWLRLGNPTEPDCYWKHVLGLQSRKRCEAEYSVTITDVTPPPEPISGALDKAGAKPGETPASTPDIAPVMAAPAADEIYSDENPYSAGKIQLNISPQAPRKMAAQISEDLSASGWPVAGGAEAVQVVQDAPDDNEVRYFDEADQTAAVELAHQVQALTPATPVKVKDFSSLGRIASQGDLEIWLSNISQ